MMPCRRVFFRRWYEVLDLIVIVLSTVLTIIYIIIDDHQERDEETGEIIISYVRVPCTHFTFHAIYILFSAHTHSLYD